MTTDRAPQELILEVVIDALAATAEVTIPAGEAEDSLELTSAEHIPAANIAGANTNSRSLVVINKGSDGNGTTEMARLDYLSGVNANDFDSKAFTLNATEANRYVAANDVIAVFSDAVGASGLADPGGRVKLTFSRR